MELMQSLMIGFETALTFQNLFYCFIGVALGTAIGVLPGLGPLATITMLLPVTYGLPPTAALIMLAGIYYGAQYGGSTTAILVNLPGELSSVVTCIDGHQMAKNGRAGTALAAAALASFLAGTIATLVVAACAPILTELAFEFGPTEYFSLMALGLIGAVVLAHGSLLKAIGMIFIGVILGLVGSDVNSGAIRFSFGIPELEDGISLVGISMGAFAFVEIITHLEAKTSRGTVIAKVKGLWLNRTELRQAAPAALRGTLLGSLLGVLPGGGALLASFASYALEKKISKTPEGFGKGAIEGVAGPEAANNAGAQTSFIPMLTLGIPATATMALLVGAMTIHNIQPGPQVMTSNPELFWGLIASMWVGNLMLVVLNLPMIGIWIRLLTMPYKVLYLAILLFCTIGAFSAVNSVFDIKIAALFGLVGYIFHKLKCEPAPLLLGFVLGPMMEENFRRAMLLAHGDLSVFITEPISAVLLACSAAMIIVVALPFIRNKRDTTFTEEES